MLAIGGAAYFAYKKGLFNQLMPPKPQDDGSEDLGKDKPAPPAAKTLDYPLIAMAKKDKSLKEQVKILQVGMNRLLKDLDNPLKIDVDGWFGEQSEKAWKIVFGDHMIPVTSANTINWGIKSLISRKVINKSEEKKLKKDVQFLSNEWWANLWK